ncbi:alpha/beta hydrolase domain-containing protein [Haloechinothrix halophila]|uniref:alpha/beta hydrolase domain-containing protein n=1 Tax=Haloechinothrix halophila TaxID=1069073 RepID=UPI0012FA2338|nr:alpha/beta hydrolase domain-containing protein [Haloechinothrix halophila]
MTRPLSIGRCCAVLLALHVLLAATPASGTPQDRSDPDWTVSGPIEGGVFDRPQTDSRFSLEPFGYVEEEYFITGTADTYTSEPSRADYTTRFVVRRPVHPARFNGTTIVEWNNVSAQFDNTPDWLWAHETILRRGYAYVHVSAQAAGHCCAPGSLKLTDPPRYEPLSHPGDDYSFDIFTQVAEAVSTPAVRGVDPMGSLRTRRVLAAGHSQSGFRLSDYVTDVQDKAKVIDGFLIDGGGKRGASASEPSVPVLNVLEEVFFTPEPASAAPNYRLWEVAGSAHADYWLLRHETDAADHIVMPGHEPYPAGWEAAEHEVAGNYGYDIEPRELICTAGGNMFPKRYAVSAALVRLDEWVKGRGAPIQPPRAEFIETGQLARDEFGNVKGGLRLPPIDVPVARYLGASCGLFGATIPLDPATLAELYPDHQTYVAMMRDATDAAVNKGILLPEDAEDLMRRARQSSIPEHGVDSPLPPR